MEITDEEKKVIIVNEILIPSLHMLYKEDYSNILWSVSERNICARLAHHMENYMHLYDKKHDSDIFYNYFADVEYNRMGNGDKKYYRGEDNKGKYMVSDLLIHSRDGGPNYLAVEMKNAKNKKNVEEDKIRLKSLVSTQPFDADHPCVYGTLEGAFITYSPQKVDVELYEDVFGKGQKVGEMFFEYGNNGLMLKGNTNHANKSV